MPPYHGVTHSATIKPAVQSNHAAPAAMALAAQRGMGTRLPRQAAPRLSTGSIGRACRAPAVRPERGLKIAAGTGRWPAEPFAQEPTPAT